MEEIVGMECPDCDDGIIVVDNLLNTMDHHCDKCFRHYTVDYLFGFRDGLIRASEPVS